METALIVANIDLKRGRAMALAGLILGGAAPGETGIFDWQGRAKIQSAKTPTAAPDPPLTLEDGPRTVALDRAGDQRFAVKHPRWEPDAGMPHVRFCAGGAQ